MASSNVVPGTFTANDAEWKVTKDGSFIICVKDLETGEVVDHVGPATQWLPIIQQCAASHRATWMAQNK